ncbi:MAG: 5'-nucleotidase C-terminal domain-containing protein, partial [Bacteroidota bacterium]|nr:5'-nucleotidase C-terminal domain-containing protein [Bacteroidota bacterium]
LILPYRQKVEQRMNEVIGTAPMELKADLVESPLGNFVADLQRSQAATLLGRPIDMGLMTRGGLRYIIPYGKITVGNVFELMPFENELLVLTLPGSTVEKLFQFGAKNKILSVSNASFTVQNGQATNILVGGQPLDTQKTYTLAVSDYLANGGDNLGFLKEAIKTEKAGILVRDAIIQKIKQLTAQGKQVEAQIEGRVKVL